MDHEVSPTTQEFLSLNRRNNEENHEIIQELIERPNNRNLVRNFNNELVLMVCLMIALFFVNIFSIAKNQILKTINNVVRKILQKILNFPIGEDMQIKEKLKNKFEINHCAICLTNLKNEVSVSCYHRFCGQCIIKYWHSQNLIQLRCPICRRMINLLHIDYEYDYKKQESMKITQEIFHYNYLYSQSPRSFSEYLMDTPFILTKTLSFVLTKEGFKLVIKQIKSSAFMLLMMIYCLSPIDIIPECIFGILGLIDDLFVFFVVFLLISNFYYRNLCRESALGYLRGIEF